MPDPSIITATERGCPPLETARLRLQAHTAADFDGLHTLWSDANITRHIGGVPSSRTESWSRLLRYRGLWSILGYGYWSIRLRSSGHYVRDVGFADFHRDAKPSIAGVPEAGWALATWAQGTGLASEAVSAALAWLDENTGYHRVLALINSSNASSIGVATKNGFTPASPLQLGAACVPCWHRDR